MQIEQNNYVNVFIDKEKHIKINLGGFLSFLRSAQLCEITIASSCLPLFCFINGKENLSAYMNMYICTVTSLTMFIAWYIKQKIFYSFQFNMPFKLYYFFMPIIVVLAFPFPRMF